MEWKNLMHKQTQGLVYNALKEKKSWFMVSFTILFITVVIMPYVIGTGIEAGYIFVGIIEVFALVFINCMIDFSYLHDSRKLAYHLSKPITEMQKINVIIVVNLIYTAVMMGLLGIASYFVYDSMVDVFLVTIPWLMAGILTSALSAVLTGNTIAAALATVINFTLPLSFLAIINYFFQITQEIAVGFNSRILSNNFIEKIYRIDILYFVKYAEEKFDYSYFVVLAVVLSGLYLLTIILSKRRKNERTGDFVVSDGYKSLISLLVASLVPIAFLQVIYDGSFIAKMVSFVILSALAFYLINSVLEKSFKPSRYALKLFAGFMVFFMLFIVIADVTTSRFEAKVPVASEISAVYLGENTQVVLENHEEVLDIYNASEEKVRKSDNIVLYEDLDTVQNIIDFHHELIKNQEYYQYVNFTIVYYYKNGDKLYRYYTLNSTPDYDGSKDDFILNLINSDEFKNKKLAFVYDDNYYDSLDITNVNVHYEPLDYNTQRDVITLEDLDMDVLRKNLAKDYDIFLQDFRNGLNFAIQSKDEYYIQDDYYSYKREVPETTKEDRTSYYYLEIGFDATKDFYKNYISIILSIRLTILRT